MDTSLQWAATFLAADFLLDTWNNTIKIKKIGVKFNYPWFILSNKIYPWLAIKPFACFTSVVNTLTLFLWSVRVKTIKKCGQFVYWTSCHLVWKIIDWTIKPYNKPHSSECGTFNKQVQWNRFSSLPKLLYYCQDKFN